MPDSRTPCPVPRSWSDALIALPLETPPPDSWATLASRLPPSVIARPLYQRLPGRVAIAAALMLAVLLPTWQVIQPAPPAAPAIATRPAIAPPAADPTPIYGDAATHASLPADTQPSETGVTAAREGNAGAVGTADAALKATRQMPAVASARPTAPRPDPLDALYAESAQLEAVLAQLPESHMANAATEALSAGLQDRVASIDAALSQPAVPSDAQADLWQQRVDTLRQLTGVEATQRWQVARGDLPSHDPSIY